MTEEQEQQQENVEEVQVISFFLLFNFILEKHYEFFLLIGKKK